jgi:hypothetical protein
MILGEVRGAEAVLLYVQIYPQRKKKRGKAIPVTACEGP